MRLLVVEDEQHLAVGLRFNFEAEGYEVELRSDGPSAIRAFREDPTRYDLVLLDLMLPGMSGYEICERLREISPTVPILVLSARTLSEDKTRAFDLGIDQYMTKPFDLKELLSRVRNLTERDRRGVRKGAAGEIYEFADARVDFRKFEVLVGKKKRKLTPMEFRLLELFVRHEGEVLSRAEILDKVWNISPPPATRTVDNFVMRLRKHFEKDPARPRHFIALRGAGYRFVAQGAEPTADESTDPEPDERTP